MLSVNDITSIQQALPKEWCVTSDNAEHPEMLALVHLQTDYVWYQLRTHQVDLININNTFKSVTRPKRILQVINLFLSEVRKHERQAQTTSTNEKQSTTD